MSASRLQGYFCRSLAKSMQLDFPSVNVRPGISISTGVPRNWATSRVGTQSWKARESMCAASHADSFLRCDCSGLRLLLGVDLAIFAASCCEKARDECSRPAQLIKIPCSVLLTSSCLGSARAASRTRRPANITVAAASAAMMLTNQQTASWAPICCR